MGLEFRIKRVLGQQFHGWVTNPLADWPQRLDDLARFAGQELGPLAPLVLVGFAVTAVRLPRYALLTGSTMLITLFFNAIYPDGAIDRYYIGPALLAWTWLAILAATVVQVVLGNVGTPPVGRRTGGTRVDRLRSIDLVGGVATAALAAVLIAPTLFALPQRARAVDHSQDRAAELWTDDVMSTLEPNAVVISWWSYSTPLWYGQIVAGRRPDIEIIDDRNRVDRNLGELNEVIGLFIADRPVYVIRNDPRELDQVAQRYTITSLRPGAASNVYRVTPRSAAAVPTTGAGE